MKYKFCSIRINVTKYDVTFATGGSITPKSSPCYATGWERGKLFNLAWNITTNPKVFQVKVKRSWPLRPHWLRHATEPPNYCAAFAAILYTTLTANICS